MALDDWPMYEDGPVPPSAENKLCRFEAALYNARGELVVWSRCEWQEGHLDVPAGLRGHRIPVPNAGPYLFALPSEPSMSWRWAEE